MPRFVANAASLKELIRDTNSQEEDLMFALRNQRVQLPTDSQKNPFRIKPRTVHFVIIHPRTGEWVGRINRGTTGGEWMDVYYDPRQKLWKENPKQS